MLRLPALLHVLTMLRLPAMPAVPSLPPAPYRRRRARRPTSLPDCSSRTTNHSPLPPAHGCLSLPKDVHYPSKPHTPIPNAPRSAASALAPPSSLAPHFPPLAPRPPPVHGEPSPVRGELVSVRGEPGRRRRRPESNHTPAPNHSPRPTLPASPHPSFRRPQPESSLLPPALPAPLDSRVRGNDGACRHCGVHLPTFRRPQPEPSLRPPTHPGHAEKGPASPQEFFRKNSYCARGAPFRAPGLSPRSPGRRPSGGRFTLAGTDRVAEPG